MPVLILTPAKFDRNTIARKVQAVIDGFKYRIPVPYEILSNPEVFYALRAHYVPSMNHMYVGTRTIELHLKQEDYIFDETNGEWEIMSIGTSIRED